MLKPLIGFLVVVSLLLSVADSRPTVRNVKTDREFQRLIKHHKEKTGLPVIVDYFLMGVGLADKSPLTISSWQSNIKGEQCLRRWT